MPIGDDYVTLPEMRAYLKTDAGWTQTDPVMESSIAAASRYVDRHCRRQFNKTDTASERSFRTHGDCVLYVDDFYTTDGLLIDGEPYDPDRCVLEPEDGVYEGMPGWPFYKIRYDYPQTGGRIKVTAKWGWAEVPDPIKQATLMQAGHLYKMSDAPNGVAGMDQFGAVRIRSLPQVDDLLCPFVSNKILVG